MMTTKLKRWGLTMVTLAVFLPLVATTGAAGDAAHPRDLSLPELGEVTVPDTQRHELSNGLILYLLEDREFPMIEVRALIHGGSAFDPPGKIGLAQFTAEVVRSGGSDRFKGDALDEKIERLGMSIHVSAAEARFNASLSMMSENLDEGLDILSDVLLRPVFPEDKLDESRTQEKTAIAARNDEPLGIAIRELSKRVYGPSSPYGWHTEYATINAIDTGDMRDVHDRYFHPNYTILVAWGDFDAAEMKEKIEHVFGGWEATTKAVPKVPTTPEPTAAKLHYAEKADITQSTILIGGISIDRRDPLFAPGELLEESLGGGFASRLFNKIRTERGLAYMTGAFVSPRFHRKGTAGAYCATQSDSTIVALRLMIDEIQAVIRDGLTEEEIERGRDAILNRFVFDFDTPGEVAYRLAQYEFFGYPADFLEKYQEGIRTATLADVKAAAEAIFRPTDWQIIVVGVQDDFAEPLSTIMPVTEIDISIPEPEVEFTVPEMTDEGLEAGQALLSAAIDAAGGADAIGQIETVTMVGAGTAAIQGMTLQINFRGIRVLPDKQYFEQSVMGQTIKQAIDGESGWRMTPMGPQDMTAEEVAEAKDDDMTDALHLYLHGGEMQIQATGQEEIDGTTYDVAYVHEAGDMMVRLYFNPESHLIARTVSMGSHPMTGAPVEKTSIVSDHRVVDGVRFAHAMEELLDGQPFFSGTIEQVTLNGEVDPALFSKP